MKGRKLLMIPGPIEFEPEVLQALSIPTHSHVAPDFIESFGRSLEMMKKVWMSDTGQPFILAGSGTLAMDLAGANLIEKGEKALVISTGYFGTRYADLLQRYGADVTILSSEPGDIVPYDKWESVAGCYPPETRLRRVLGEEEYSFVVVSQTLLNNNSRPAPYQLASVLIGLFNLVGDKVYFMVSSSQNEQKLGYIKEKILDGFKEQKAIDKYDLTDLLVK